jgi:hypothetical protein
MVRSVTLVDAMEDPGVVCSGGEIGETSPCDGEIYVEGRLGGNSTQRVNVTCQAEEVGVILFQALLVVIEALGHDLKCKIHSIA